MKTYEVKRPIKGTQSFLVEAKTAKEAQRMVDEHKTTADEALDFDVHTYGKAKARLMEG